MLDDKRKVLVHQGLACADLHEPQQVRLHARFDIVFADGERYARGLAKLREAIG